MSNIKELVKSQYPQVQKIYETLHKYPELDWDLPKTFKIITDELKKNKIKYQVVDKYGIIVTINGKNKGKCILLRADMDGLPIEEESGVSYTSLHKGKMHACGHDSHSANLLGVLFILNKMKNEFNGTVKFMFQPAEEMSGGADHFIKAGILQNPKVDASLAIHQGNSGAGKNFKPGEIVVRYGCSNASVDDFKIEIIGKSGHAASPQKSINPIIIASNFITCAQNILTQKVSPDSLVILSFGSINGGSAPNIIPDKVELIGTLRTLDEDIRNKVMEEFKKLLEGICKLNGATYDLKWNLEWGPFCHLPPLVNDDKMVDFVKNTCEKLYGKSKVYVDKIQGMGGEDYAYISLKVPSCMYRVTVDKDSHAHNCKFKINGKDYFPTAMESLITCTIDFLKNQ